jgi:hypothetical protein
VSRVTTKSQLGANGVHSVNSVIRRSVQKPNKMRKAALLRVLANDRLVPKGGTRPSCTMPPAAALRAGQLSIISYKRWGRLVGRPSYGKASKINSTPFRIPKFVYVRGLSRRQNSAARIWFTRGSNSSFVGSVAFEFSYQLTISCLPSRRYFSISKSSIPKYEAYCGPIT